jgi:hypothetical protein
VWLVIVCLMAYQQPRSLGSGFIVYAVQCHAQDIVSEQAFDVSSAQSGYRREEWMSTKSGRAISHLLRLANIWPQEYSFLPYESSVKWCIL